MSLYCYADLTISSLMDINELRTAASVSCLDSKVLVHQLEMHPSELKNLEWIPRQNESSCLSRQYLTSSQDNTYLRFPELADFVISSDGTRLGIWTQPCTSDDTVRHLLLDQVLPRLLDHKGKLIIHAGAVRVNKHAIAFIGETGAGKSTLTASFHLNGFPLLSDDGLLITADPTGARVLPTYSSLRLWPDSVAELYTDTPLMTPMAHYSTKQRLTIEEPAEEKVEALPLAAIFLLASKEVHKKENIRITRLRPIDSCMTIISNSFQLDVNDKQRAIDRLKDAATISQSVPVYRLEYERDFSALSDLRAAILKQIRRNPPSSEHTRQAEVS